MPLRTLPEPEVRVDLICPNCQYDWHAARILSGTWWGKSVTPDAIAKICYCPNCKAAPPMLVAPVLDE